ncbi:MAG: ATP-binding protein [Ignavibacteriaceae bacterium]
MKNSGRNVLSTKKHVILLVVILSLFITAAGYYLYKNRESTIRQEKYTELKSIADVKQSQIELWIKQRNADVKAVTNSPFFSRGIYSWLQNKGNLQLKKEIINWLQPVREDLGYENIFIASPTGDLLLSAKPGIQGFDSLITHKIIETSTKKETVFTDFYLRQNEDQIYYEIIVPVIYNGNKTIAVLVFRIDPDDYLYPLIEAWPTPSKTAETSLLRVEGGSVLYLNNLREKSNTALKLAIPLTQTDLVSVQAALGHTGIIEAIDYRGIEVLADIRKIPASDWIMVSKIDKSEIYAGLYQSAIVISAFSIFIIIICSFGFAFIYTSRQKNIFTELYSNEKELWQSQEKFKVTMDSLVEGIITLDMAGKVQYMNKLAEELTGWNNREARGRVLSEVYSVKNEETGLRESKILEKILKQGIVKELANHTILITKSGKEIPVMDSGAPIYNTDGSILGIVLAFQDETEKRHRNRILKESESRLRSTLDNLMEGCQIIGFDSRYLFLNKAALKQSRLTKEELIGRTMTECYPGIENTKMFSELQRCQENRVSVSLEYEDSYTDDSKRYLLSRFEPIPEGIFILSEDITDRKLAEQELNIATTELAFQNNEKEKRAAELIIANTELQFQNEEKEKRAAELIIANTELVFQNEEKGKRAVELMIANTELLFQNSEKEKRAAELIIANKELLFQNSEKEKRAAELGIANKELAFQNDEKEKRAAELGIANKELAFQNDEKEKRTVELIIAKEKAEEMNRLKSSFLANMSHELRTPLMCINGYADLLRQDIESLPLKEMAGDIFKSGIRLSETLNLILDLSKFESEKSEFFYQKIDLLKETEDILKLFKETVRKKGLFLKSSFSQSSVFLNIDGRAIRSILNNLINNAIKFTLEGGVTVGISRDDDFVEIRVTDTGIGISKENHQMIFEEFRQVSEGISRNFEGSGLGLNITKKLVNKFGGTISVESEVGIGTTFIVKLPVTDKKEMKEVQTPFEKARLTGVNSPEFVKRLALIVDDDPYVFNVMKRYVNHGVDLETVMDGESALELCNRKQYDFIFMDINLRHGIDGKQVTRKIRKIKGYETIPIIASTAYAMVGDKEEFLAAGCTHYLSKPFTQEIVSQLIEEIISGK